jgi:hypothetical protein
MVGMLVALLVSTLGIWMAINAIIAPTYAELETQDAKKRPLSLSKLTVISVATLATEPQTGPFGTTVTSS